ncbi:uncharacterized protein H6S33_011592 [Morchella sextelata]|uniref:uncharacterized protein n=1 Tax=Morchella sextelata TaxID=1174677 RepID=UPI001D03CF7C|nr:uncharacterized protein H6S33_011592 [Morchella sextelata]KAH0611165.1 hypothetical protein H6S33_011592 [Morchella sextelata]
MVLSPGAFVLHGTEWTKQDEQNRTDRTGQDGQDEQDGQNGTEQEKTEFVMFDNSSVSAFSIAMTLMRLNSNVAVCGYSQ